MHGKTFEHEHFMATLQGTTSYPKKSHFIGKCCYLRTFIQKHIGNISLQSFAIYLASHY